MQTLLYSILNVKTSLNDNDKKYNLGRHWHSLGPSCLSSISSSTHFFLLYLQHQPPFYLEFDFKIFLQPSASFLYLAAGSSDIEFWFRTLYIFTRYIYFYLVFSILLLLLFFPRGFGA